MKMNKPKSLRITEHAYRKAVLYAFKVCERFKSSTECIGLLTAPENNNDGIAKEVMLAYEQIVTADHAHITADGLARTMDEIDNKKLKCVGLWHSHGSAIEAHHSPIDDGELEKSAVYLASNTKRDVCVTMHDGYTVSNRPYSVSVEYNPKSEDYTIVIDTSHKIGYQVRSKSGIVTIVPNKKAQAFVGQLAFPFEKSYWKVPVDGAIVFVKTDLEHCGVSVGRLEEEVLYSEGIAHSLVVNSKGENYVEATYFLWYPGLARPIKATGKVGMDLIKDDSGSDINQKEMTALIEREISERVRLNGGV
ncbi:Mov34/MPN/PAD-1 family protein [Candidatus Woesearchaeota archaeon]|nr:Mov34/MPN/PAD-1 family protein [Candidatus Woesearchaeota archaeon]